MKFFKNKNLLNILILFVVTLIVCLPMFSSHLSIYTDDGIQHIARAFGTLEAIKNGSFFGNVIPMFANNFGYSWNIFYGSVTTFGIIFFKILTGSYILGYKLFCFFCLLLSGITMYFLVKKVSKNINVAVLAGSLYIMAPYHLTDLYVRNALGEFASFVLIPIIFLGLYNIFKEEKNDWLFTIGSVLLLFTHNITCLYTMILVVFYIIININKLKNKVILKRLGINILLIGFISSCFLFPMLEAKISAKYRVYEKDVMSTVQSLQDQRISLRRIFVTGNNEWFVFELGPYMIIMLAFSVMTIRILKKEYRKEYLFFLICGIITMFMATKIFPWNIMPKIFRMIQFPWRCLEFESFFFAIVAAINMGAVIKKFSLKDSIIIIVIAIIYIIALKGFVIYKEDAPMPIEEMELGKITGMENEWISGMGRGEYLPSKAYENRFYIATREDRIYAIEGKAVVENEEKNGSKLKAKISTFEDDVVLELPYIYYPGYEITLDGMHVNSFETENGMLGIGVNKNENTLIEVKYSGTSIMKDSMFISILGIIGLVIYIIFERKEN